ncbi:uncharacterized protein LOC105161761 isoform X1 [Sesamum indicum]|uniref:Uncharacterized protein LOC105161761 isoform X1 n=2 Tax=Sesamum indicum TaxID=4182 RepID=A0A6I9T2N1_SESIN|nr:uncharacterized protein LOC105161761 isoform X1 [Sesamum indicum]
MRGWESDPLFAAAEVVQDSADRMESIFRLLLHEQSLVQGHHTDGKLLSSIEHHRRALATTLETAKWQLEDFEREVTVSAVTDKSWVKQNMVERHMQFIAAIRQQIILVEQSMNTSVRSSVRNMNLNEQDRDGLALFLSGGKPVKHIADQESEDNNTLRRFLDPAVSSSSKEDIDEKKAGETMSLNANEIVYSDHNMELKENFPTKLDLGPSTSGHDANYGRCEEEGTWDLESNEAKGRSYLQKNKLGGYWRRMNISRSLGNFFAMHKSRASRSFTKRLKDGEEQSINVHPGMQRYLAQLRSAFGSSNFHLSCSQSAQTAQSSCWIQDHREKCQRSLHCIQAKYHPALIILAMLLILLTLSMVLS